MNLIGMWKFSSLVGFISKIDGKAVPYDGKRDDRVYGYFSTASRKGWMKYRTRER